MLKTLPHLLALQTCDQHIREIVHTLESLQALVAALEGKAHTSMTEKQRYRDKIRDAKQVRDALVAQRKQLKTQLREKKRSEQHRGPGKVKDFIQREIALLDAQKTAIEQELYIVEQRIADDTAMLHQGEDSASTLADARLRETATLREQIAATQAQLRAAQEERAGLTPDLPSFVVSEYERIFTHRGGLAVVAIAREICQGCHLHVPAHFCLELQKTPRLAVCPNCHRIVFVTPEAPVVSVSAPLSAASDYSTSARQRHARVTIPKKEPLAATRESFPKRARL